MTIIEQLNPLQDTQCSICKNKIKAGWMYFRRTIEPDSQDEYGTDICATCMEKFGTKKLP